MLHWPPPTSWAPPPTRGCENANSAQLPYNYKPIANSYIINIQHFIEITCHQTGASKVRKVLIFNDI